MGDIQESHKIELVKLENKYKSNQRVDMDTETSDRISPEIYRATQTDLEDLKHEKGHLKNMQNLMKEIITDLALHYNLSEKQLKYLSESNIFDSLSSSIGLRSREVTPINTPYKYFHEKEKQLEDKSETSMTIEVPSVKGATQVSTRSFMNSGEISELIIEDSFDSNSAHSEQILLDLRERVRLANSSLLEKGQTGSIIDRIAHVMSTPSLQGQKNRTIADADGDIGNEKSKLQEELIQAHQRIQELELSGRSSMGRSDVISGCGEGGGQGVQLGEVREKANKLLSNYKENEGGITNTELLSVLGELLIYSDNISTQANERVEDIEQQLEVADKQLKATRAFLEEQAVEREQEREDWEKKLQEVEKR